MGTQEELLSVCLCQTSFSPIDNELSPWCQQTGLQRVQIHFHLNTWCHSLPIPFFFFFPFNPWLDSDWTGKDFLSILCSSHCSWGGKILWSVQFGQFPTALASVSTRKKEDNYAWDGRVLAWQQSLAEVWGGQAAPKCVFFSNINLRKVSQIASKSCFHNFLFLLYNAIIFSLSVIMSFSTHVNWKDCSGTLANCKWNINFLLSTEYL